ncbi:MAG: leucine-rich repeat protein [Massiliimalia sp.]|jgi:glucan-binding YG repeat protein
MKKKVLVLAAALAALTTLGVSCGAEKTTDSKEDTAVVSQHTQTEKENSKAQQKSEQTEESNSESSADSVVESVLNAQKNSGKTQAMSGSGGNNSGSAASVSQDGKPAAPSKDGIPEGAEAFSGSDWDSIYPSYTIPAGAVILRTNTITNNFGGAGYVHVNMPGKDLVVYPNEKADGAEITSCKNTQLRSVYFPDTLRSLSLFHYPSQFSGCPNLTTVRLPKYVSSLPEGLFENCTGLKTIVLPERLKSLGKRVFAGCTSLREVYIPSGCTSIELQGNDSAFAGCSKDLTWVVVKGSYAEQLAQKTGQKYRTLGKAQNGWYRDGSGNVQYLKNGTPLTGLQKIDGWTYYFNQKGIMQTGIVAVNGVKIPTDDEGRLQVGLQKIDGKQYYIDNNWTYHKGFVIEFPGTHLESPGMYCNPKTGEVQSGWFDVDGQTYYAPDGHLSQYKENIDGKCYYFDSRTCALQRSKKIDDSGNWIAFTDEEGVLREGWVQWEDQTYYCALSGGAMPVAVKGWQEIGKNVYYFRENGTMFTGWLDQGGQRYYFDPNTGCLLYGWQNIGGQRYYLNSKGAMHKSWLEYQGDTYYLHYEDGYMMIGWIRIGGKWYYMDDSGKLLRNTTTPDGMKVDENGVCHEKVS